MAFYSLVLYKNLKKTSDKKFTIRLDTELVIFKLIQIKLLLIGI